MGSGFGAHVGEALVLAAIVLAIASVTVGIGLSFAVPWLFHHIHIAFS